MINNENASNIQIDVKTDDVTSTAIKAIMDIFIPLSPTQTFSVLTFVTSFIMLHASPGNANNNLDSLKSNVLGMISVLQTSSNKPATN
jgi:hypothetical protein